MVNRREFIGSLLAGMLIPTSGMALSGDICAGSPPLVSSVLTADLFLRGDGVWTIPEESDLILSADADSNLIWKPYESKT